MPETESEESARLLSLSEEELSDSLMIHFFSKVDRGTYNAAWESINNIAEDASGQSTINELIILAFAYHSTLLTYVRNARDGGQDTRVDILKRFDEAIWWTLRKMCPL